METKKCPKCGRELPVSEFWKNASKEDGLQIIAKIVARNISKKGVNLQLTI